MNRRVTEEEDIPVHETAISAASISVDKINDKLAVKLSEIVNVARYKD